MKKSKFSLTSFAQLEAYSPRNQDDDEDRWEEIEFRKWCVENELDPTNGDTREIYAEATGATFWDDLDNAEREGWEHLMMMAAWQFGPGTPLKTSARPGRSLGFKANVNLTQNSSRLSIRRIIGRFGTRIF
jgi:hypothetical protein